MNRYSFRLRSLPLRKTLGGGWILSLTLLLGMGGICLLGLHSDDWRIKSQNKAASQEYLPIRSVTAAKILKRAERRYLDGVREILGAEYSEEFYRQAVKMGRERWEEFENPQNGRFEENESPAENETFQEYLRSSLADDSQERRAVSEFLAEFSEETKNDESENGDENNVLAGETGFYLPAEWGEAFGFRNPVNDLIRFNDAEMISAPRRGEWLFRDSLLPFAFGANFTLFLAVIGVSLLEDGPFLRLAFFGDSLTRWLLFLESLTAWAGRMAGRLLEKMPRKPLRSLAKNGFSSFLGPNDSPKDYLGEYLDEKVSVSLRI